MSILIGKWVHFKINFWWDGESRIAYKNGVMKQNITKNDR